jgi:[ribosomal protein S5]-alanine N-acetyltransferase
MKIFAETDRLVLREILPEDDKEIFQLDSDPAVHRFLGNKPINSLDQAKQTIQFIRQQYIQNGIGRWAVIEKESGNFIGWSGFKLITEPINNHVNYYDLGYRFLKTHWGRGFATEAAKASLTYAFTHLNQTAIFAIADIRNLNSRKVLEKAGFSVTKIFHYQDCAHYWFKIEKKQWIKKSLSL